MIQTYKDRIVDWAAPVQVYRNLSKGGYSVRQFGRVVGHANELVLFNVSFTVNEKGRQWVLNNGTKVVHAYVEGYLPVKPSQHKTYPYMVNYNPKKGPSFYRKDTGEVVNNAVAAYLHGSGVNATMLNYKN